MFEEELFILGFVGIPQDTVGGQFSEFLAELEIILGQDEDSSQFEMSHLDDDFLEHLLDQFVLEVSAEVVDDEHGVSVLCSIGLCFGVDFFEHLFIQFVVKVLFGAVFLEDVVPIGDGVETDFRDDYDDVVVGLLVEALEGGYNPTRFPASHTPA